MSVVVGSVSLVVLVAWSARPQPTSRAWHAPRTRSRRWVLVLLAAVTAIAAPMLMLAFTVTALILRRASAARRLTRTRRQISTDYPDALDLLVLSIRAGYLPAQAIVEITPHLSPPLRAPFAAVAEAMEGGARFADALQQLTAGIGPTAQPLVDSLSAADRYGLPLAPVLERLAFDARQQRRRDADAAARELPVRLAVPLVLCTLPSFVLLAIVPLLLGALSSLHT